MTTYALPISPDLAERLVNLPKEQVKAAEEAAAQMLDEALNQWQTDQALLKEPLDDETITALRESIAEVKAGGKLYTLDEWDAAMEKAAYRGATRAMAI